VTVLRRFFLLFLVVSLLPSAGALDLCACEASSHGLFCAAPTPSAGSTTAAGGCCASKAEAPGPVADHAEGEGCACPSLLLAESEPRVVAAPPVMSALALAPTGALQTAATPPRARSLRPAWTARPPPPVRLHLLFAVQRC
jgi:hypothetical protein